MLTAFVDNMVSVITNDGRHIVVSCEVHPRSTALPCAVTGPNPVPHASSPVLARPFLFLSLSSPSSSLPRPRVLESHALWRSARGPRGLFLPAFFARC